jgi:hypothetical protein
MKPEPSPLPFGLLMIDFAGMVLLGVGVSGAFGALDGLIEPFAQDRRIAWFVAAAGAVLIAAALPGIVRWAKDAAVRGRR